MSIKQSTQNEFNAIIEIPMNSQPVKYELDHDTNILVVDRFGQTAMFYPANYGFIPDTLSLDTDPLDVLVVAHYPVVPGALIRSRPIGVLIMEDDAGMDEKIIAVPTNKVDISFSHIETLEDLDVTIKKRIQHFFEHYKDLEQGKWVKIKEWGSVEQAKETIASALERYKNA